MRLVAALLALAAIPSAAAAQAVAVTLTPGEVPISVEAEGVHRARPDVMTITAGVVTTGRTAREALASNAAVATRLVEAVRAKGVAPADVRTSELSVAPRFARDRSEDEEEAPRITGYIARNQLELRLRDLATSPELIDALFTAGANSVQGPEFSLSNPAPAHREARRAAVAAALEEAET